jgi:hypothetical protein
VEAAVIAGHFGFAAAVKSRERQAPLWALMLACQWLDVIFIGTYALGLERLEPVGSGGYGQVIIHAGWTHSLLGALILSALLGAFWRGRTGLVIAAVAFSHWVLDLIVHRPDLPLLPANAGGFPLLGFGLWRSAPAAAGLELLLVAGGAALYWRAALQTGARRAANLAGAAVLGSGLLTLAINLAGF